ncbi:MAG: PAS domain S-box protein [Cyanobacteriota bacterium]|nr:PAS domain S-box protein [Cyanobacteriota bacterium]
MSKRDARKPRVLSNLPTEPQLEGNELATILNTMEALVVAFAPQGQILWVNSTCERVMGYSGTELKGRYVWEAVVPPQERSTVRCLFEQLQTARVADKLEYSWLARDGSLKRIAWSHTILYDEGGGVKTLVATGVEIVDRQLEGEQLLNAIAHRLCQSLDLQDILNATVAEIRQWYQCDRALVYRFDSDGSGMALAESLSIGDWTPMLGQQIYDPCFKTGFADRYRQGRVAVIEDVNQVNLTPCYLDLLNVFQVKASAVFPIIWEERLWGLFMLHQCASPRKWQSSELTLLTQLTARVALAIGHCELYEKLKVQLQEQKGVESVLEFAKDDLEERVAERTAQLRKINGKLLLELEERRRVEKALELSQVRFARIVEIADDAIIAIDESQRITLFNRGAERIFGWREREILGQPLARLLPERFIDLHRQHVEGFARTDTPVRRMGERREIWGRRKDGSEFPAEASIARLHLENETIFTVILRDVTERWQIERMKDEFIAVISHELRTPLTGIQGAVDMLTSGLLDAQPQKRQHLLEIAADSTKRLVRLVNDILDLGQLASGEIKMLKQPCDAAQLMLDAADGVGAAAQARDVNVSVSPMSVRLYADCDRLAQVLAHLLHNAVKFSPPQATVWLRAELTRGEAVEEGNSELGSLSAPILYLQFQIEDRGRGIPEEQLETIFERFKQVDGSDSRDLKGTGLGLAICHSIVTQHGGKIWAESTLGQGSIFYVAVPIENESPTETETEFD